MAFSKSFSGLYYMGPGYVWEMIYPYNLALGFEGSSLLLTVLLLVLSLHLS